MIIGAPVYIGRLPKPARAYLAAHEQALLRVRLGLFACGATEVSLRLKKEPEGLRLLVQGDYAAEHRPKLERLSKLLQPEIRDPALAETFWELAGADMAHDTSELALVGQILDGAHVAIEDAGVSMDLFVAR